MKVQIRIAALLLIWLTALCAGAQTPLEKANNIKRAADKYFFGQSTVADKKEAKAAAENILIVTVSEWLSENASNSPFSPELARQFQYIEVPKGNYTTVLVYIERSTVAEYAQGATTSQPTATKVQEKEENKSVDLTPGYEDLETISVAVTPEYSDDDFPALTQAQTEIIKEILKAGNLYDAFRLLENYRARRKIKNFGDLSTQANKMDCFVIIGTSNQKIETVLSCGPTRYNYKLNRNDRLENYTRRPAVWFTFD